MNSKKFDVKRIVISLIAGVLLIAVGVTAGYFLGATGTEEPETTGYVENPAFYIAEKNIDEIVGFADNGLNGYHWVESNGEKKLYLDEKECALFVISTTP